MLGSDLALLYGIETKVLKQSVKRNLSRFPEDFMFELTKIEYDSSRSQIVTSSFFKFLFQYLYSWRSRIMTSNSYKISFNTL